MFDAMGWSALCGVFLSGLSFKYLGLCLGLCRRKGVRLRAGHGSTFGRGNFAVSSQAVLALSVGRTSVFFSHVPVFMLLVSCVSLLSYDLVVSIRRSECAASREQLAAKQQEAADQGDSVIGLEENTVLGDELDSQPQEVARLQEELNRVKKSVAVVQEELKLSEESVADLEAESTVLGDELDSANEELVSKEEQAAVLNRELQASKQVASKLQENLASALKQVSGLERCRKALQEQVKEKE